MTEGTPRSIKDTATWAIDRIAERMQQEPVPLHKEQLPVGYGFRAQDPDNAHDRCYAALFPQEQVVRIGAPDLEIRIKNATARPAQDGIEVRAGDGSVRAMFLRDGHIAVEVFPIPALAVTEAALRDENESDEEIALPSSTSDSGASLREIDLSGDLTRDTGSERYESRMGTGYDADATRAEFDRGYPELRQILDPEAFAAEQIARDQRERDAVDAMANATPPLRPSSGTNNGAEAQPTTPTPETETNPNRVKNLRGRVATDPNLAPTPQGKPRVQFVLAEHVEAEDDEQTIFHRVYTLNKQAESLQRRGLEKGQKVGVDGYRQQREVKKRDGSTAQSEIIYANVVRTFGKRDQAVTDEARREPKE